MNQNDKAIIIDDSLKDFIYTVVDAAFNLGYLYREQQPMLDFSVEEAKAHIQESAWEALNTAHSEHIEETENTDIKN